MKVTYNYVSLFEFGHIFILIQYKDVLIYLNFTYINARECVLDNKPEFPLQ